MFGRAKIRELEARIKTLEAEIDSLRQENRELRSQLASEHVLNERAAEASRGARQTYQAALEARDAIIGSMLKRLDAIERGGAPRVGDEVGLPSAEGP